MRVLRRLGELKTERHMAPPALQITVLPITSSAIQQLWAVSLEKQELTLAADNCGPPLEANAKGISNAFRYTRATASHHV